MKNIIGLFCILSLFTGFMLGPPTSEATLKMALLKYNGGGDWYANPTALPNLATFCNTNLQTNFDTDFETVEVGLSLIHI